VEIVGNNGFMPLWYTLSCSKNSKGNALEMANTFYETGFFSNVAEGDLSSSTSLNVSTLKRGFYFLKIRIGDDQEEVHHIVIE
jgi:hypothetical protein